VLRLLRWRLRSGRLVADANVNAVRNVVRTANEIKLARKQKVTWSITEIEQEIAWKTWFPQLGVDWTRELPDDQVRVLYDGFLKFCEDNLFIKFPGVGRMPFRLRPAQQEIVWAWIKYRRNICLKARQIGFSTLVSAFALWLAFGWGDRHIVMLSRTERESVALLAKTRYGFRHLPEWVKLRGPKLLDRTRQVMTFDNDSVIQSLPSNNDPARGESLFLVVLDEWAFLPNPEEAWASVEPTTDLGGRVIGLSTANGEGNFFHEMWVGAEMGTNGFNPLFYPWSAVDTRDEDWYERKKHELSNKLWQLHQEYPSNAAEAFVGSGNPVFNMEIVGQFRSEVGSDFTISGSRPKEVALFEGGPFTVWEAPNEKDRWAYVVGADIAEGLEHGDATVAWVLCVNTGRPVACWYGRVDPDVFGEQILPAIGWFYRTALIVPEVNNHGLTVLKALQRSKYKNLYKRRTFTKRVDRPLESMGWLTTHTSKPLVIDGLQAWLRDVENVPHGKTIHELRTFSRAANGRMSGSPHDDCVMALAIAVQGLRYAKVERPRNEVDASRVKGSFAWYESKLDEQSRKSGSAGLSPLV
jgi:hypothetical protein